MWRPRLRASGEDNLWNAELAPGDSKPSVTLGNRDEINIVVDALQDKLGRMYRAHQHLATVSPSLAEMMAQKIRKAQHLADKIRVGWKRAPAIPDELLRAKEDRRFWTDVEALVRKREDLSHIRFGLKVSGRGLAGAGLNTAFDETYQWREALGEDVYAWYP